MASEEDMVTLYNILESKKIVSGWSAMAYEEPKCDICPARGTNYRAVVDGRMHNGAWAFMCKDHFRENGIGLGMGKGQVLLYSEE